MDNVRNYLSFRKRIAGIFHPAPPFFSLYRNTQIAGVHVVPMLITVFRNQIMADQVFPVV